MTFKDSRYTPFQIDLPAQNMINRYAFVSREIKNKNKPRLMPGIYLIAYVSTKYNSLGIATQHGKTGYEDLIWVKLEDAYILLERV